MDSLRTDAYAGAEDGSRKSEVVKILRDFALYNINYCKH